MIGISLFPSLSLSFRDLIKDVAVSLVPLALNKHDHADHSSMPAHEKGSKKVSSSPEMRIHFHMMDDFRLSRLVH